MMNYVPTACIPIEETNRQTHAIENIRNANNMSRIGQYKPEVEYHSREGKRVSRRRQPMTPSKTYMS